MENRAASEPLDALAARIRARFEAGRDGTLKTARRIRKAVCRDLEDEPGRRVVEWALHEVEAAEIPRWFLYEILRDHPQAMAALGPQQVVRLAGDLTSWGDVDAFGTLLAGQAWRRGRLSDVDILRWARRPEPFWRRAALVSTVPLNSKAQGGAGDPERTLRVCEALRDDRQDLVVKAMSWALRELSMRDPVAVENYLASRGKDLAPRVIREVRNKLTTGLKNPKKGTKT